MAAPKGNKFWMMRSKHGRDKLFASPQLIKFRGINQPPRLAAKR
jgi:hypothetical protein